jgi:hypothetical protein
VSKIVDGPVPVDVAIALSRLNEHARTHGCGREAIYVYKALAALLAASAGQADVRPVATMAKCHYCDGTGRFICIYEGPTRERCRKCSGTGYVHLRFVATTIASQAWHHPWERSGREIFCAAHPGATIEYLHVTRELQILRAGSEPVRIGFGGLGNWTPNRPGMRLKGEDAAALLNRAEDWVLALRDVDPALRWPLERARGATRSYQLELGRIGTACHYCGNAETSIGEGHIGERLWWSVPVCKTHEAMPSDQKDNLIPREACTSEVMRWLARRGKVIASGGDVTAEAGI